MGTIFLQNTTTYCQAGWSESNSDGNEEETPVFQELPKNETEKIAEPRIQMIPEFVSSIRHATATALHNVVEGFAKGYRHITESADPTEESGAAGMENEEEEEEDAVDLEQKKTEASTEAFETWYPPEDEKIYRIPESEEQNTARKVWRKKRVPSSVRKKLTHVKYIRIYVAITAILVQVQTASPVPLCAVDSDGRTTGSGGGWCAFGYCLTKQEPVTEVTLMRQGNKTFVCKTPYPGNVIWQFLDHEGHLFNVENERGILANIAAVYSSMNPCGTVSTLSLPEAVHFMDDWSVSCMSPGERPSAELTVGITRRTRRSAVRDGLIVKNHKGETLKRFDKVDPEKDLSVQIVVPNAIECPRLQLHGNDNIITDLKLREKGYRRARSASENMITMSNKVRIKPYDSWLLLSAFCGDQKDSVIGSLLLENSGDGPYKEEPENECGVEPKSAKFSCTFHPGLKDEIYWYMVAYKEDMTIWVATDNTTYRPDLATVDTELTVDGSKTSTLYIRGLIDTTKEHGVYCSMLEQRSSRHGKLYPAELSVENKISFEIKHHSGEIIQDGEQIFEGDKLHILFSSLHGNPKPGLQLYLNGNLDEHIKSQSICDDKVEPTKMKHVCIVEKGLSQLDVVLKETHPKLTQPQDYAKHFKIAPHPEGKHIKPTHVRTGPPLPSSATKGDPSPVFVFIILCGYVLALIKE